MLTITAGHWSARLLPELGGSIATLRYREVDVLRRTPDAPGILDTACFPLVPYANRIAHGCFSFAGHDHRLPLNFGDHPHSLHGLGWQASWRVVEHGEAHAVLGHAHVGGADWPWRYSAEQRFDIDAYGLTIALTLTNEDDMPMPAGVGLHPYFPAASDTRLTLQADAVWLSDDTQLPTKAAPPDRLGNWAAGDSVARDTLVDHAYAGWDGAATIEGDHGRTTLAATGACAAHIYIPPGAGFLCVEPVSHLPDAINRADMTMGVLAPHGSMRISLTIGHC